MALKDLPRITFVGYHSCIRSFKQAAALKERGYHVNWVCNMPPPQISFHSFDSVLIYTLGDGNINGKIDRDHHFDHFKKTIQFVDKHTDIYHTYNEPDWFTYTIKQLSDKPVVWDLHDLASERDFIVRLDEELEFKSADAIIVQGLGYKQVAEERRPDLKEKGLVEICLSAVPRIYWPNLDLPLVMHGGKKLGGVVYEGGLAAGKQGAQEHRYRWWLPFMAELASLNISISAQVASGGDYSAYNQAGVRICPMTMYNQMLQSLTLYDWGLCGNAVHHSAFDKAWPNKLFEYLAAGLPILVHDSKEVAQFVKDEKIGVEIQSPKDVVKVFPTSREFIPNVIKAREKYCMENEITKVINIYNKLLK